RGLGPRNPFLGEASEGAAEAPPRERSRWALIIALAHELGDPEVDHQDPQILVEHRLGGSAPAPPAVHGEVVVRGGDDGPLGVILAILSRPDDLDPPGVLR